MIMFKAEKEDLTIQVEGNTDVIVCEIAGMLDAVMQDKRIGKLFLKALALLNAYEGGENDKQSSSDRAIN